MSALFPGNACHGGDTSNSSKTHSLPSTLAPLPATLQDVIYVPNGVDREVSDNDMEVRAKDSNCWGQFLSSCAIKVKAYFGSTHLHEMAFSQMKIIKTKHRICLIDRHFTDCVRLGVSNYEPNYRVHRVQSLPNFCKVFHRVV